MRKVKANEPSFVVHTVRVVGEVKGIAYEAVDAITSANAKALYHWI